MSSRAYPLWKPGAPQLRVFLPDFLMKLVKPAYPMPKHIVKFEVPIKMSQTDVKNYLEKIYNVPVKHVRLELIRGERFTHPASGSDAEHFKPDQKFAYASVGRSVKFSFPDLSPAEAEKEVQKENEGYEDSIQKMRSQRQVHWDRSGAPTWFS